MSIAPIGKRVWKWKQALTNLLGSSGLALAATYLGLFQPLEGAIWDRFMQLRPVEAPDDRIVLIAIDEADIHEIGQWPLPDGVLAELLNRVRSQQPRVIGLHLYRDIPVAPGSDRLVQLLQSTPNLIGMEKLVGDAIAPPPILKQLGRVALADMVLDPDGKVRRGLVSIRREPERELRMSFAAQLALMYLEQEGIVIEAVEDGSSTVKFGQATIEPLRPHDGAYVRIDDGGYQIMLNYRGTQENFLTVSMSDVMAGRIDPDLLRDRIAIVGPTAASLKEKYNTPYSSSIGKSYQQMSSLVIHANLTSQLLSAALDNRQVFRFLPELVEWGLVVVWSSVGIVLSYHGWRLSQFHNQFGCGWSVLLGYTALVCMAPPAIGYIAFLNGWWIPVVSPLVGALAGVVMVAAYKTHALQQLATCDGLTQVANRRYFDLYLHRTWLSSQRRQRSLSLILCDVDYFKAYNDNYGHRQGDLCLQQIAQALSLSVRHSDLVARYGGEEFAVILPDTQIDDAVRVAQRVGESVRSLNIPHRASEIAPHVTLSCGITSFVPQGWATPHDLIQAADSALYEAKKRGRNTYALRSM